MTPSQSTDDLVKRLRAYFEKWCAENCSSGADRSAWYWRLYQAGAQAGSANQQDTIERLQADLAARDKTIETMRGQTFAWLVEKQSPEGAVWITANGQWTRDANEACWFTRKLDAELFTFNLGSNATAVEHCFIAARSEGGKPK